MKKTLTLLFVIITTLGMSQSLEKLDSVSAHNLYVSTSKKQVLTQYDTKNEPTYVLFYGDGNVGNLTGYDFIVFDSKNELTSFLNMVQRSIIKSNLIIYKFEKHKIVIKGVTSQSAELNVNKYNFFLNTSTINDIRKQLN